MPAAFAGTQEAAYELIDAEPFATVIASGAEGIVASHLPLMREGDTLLGHLAGPNPQADLLADCAKRGREVLAISAATGAGLDRLVAAIAAALDRREALS